MVLQPQENDYKYYFISRKGCYDLIYNINQIKKPKTTKKKYKNMIYF